MKEDLDNESYVVWSPNFKASNNIENPYDLFGNDKFVYDNKLGYFEVVVSIEIPMFDVELCECKIYETRTKLMNLRDSNIVGISEIYLNELLLKDKVKGKFLTFRISVKNIKEEIFSVVRLLSTYIARSENPFGDTYIERFSKIIELINSLILKP